MTPSQRVLSSAIKWLTISIQGTATDAETVQALVNEFTAQYPGEDPEFVGRLQGLAVKMRQNARRCAHHGLGMTPQELLPLKPKE